MEALKLYTSPADLLVRITTPHERVKTRLKEIPRPPSSFTVSSSSSKSESIDRLSTVTTPTTTTEPSPDRTTAAISISPTPQVFRMQKFYVSPSMSMDESIQDIWTGQIKSRLSAILWRKIPSGTCVQEFVMMGKRSNALKPTVVITCGDLVTKKRVEKIFKDLGWLQELLKVNHMVFVALVAKTPLSAGPVLDNGRIEILQGSYAVQLPRAEVRTSCGLELLINGANSHLRQRCTLGGLLVVKGRVMGLTAGHPFSRVADNFLPRQISEATDDIDDSSDAESSSISSEPYVFDPDSDDDESDGLFSSNLPPFEHVDSLPSPIDEIDCDRHQDSGSSLSVEWSVPQAAILSSSTPKYVSSMEDPLNGYDWALLDSLPLSVKMRPNAIFDADQLTHTPIGGISSTPACGRVAVSAAGVRSQHGYLHNSPVTMQVNGSILDVQLLILETILPLGSSGAWVVRGDQLCGYIIAIRQDIPWAYMAAIQPVLEDIGRRFKTVDVRLPTAAEIESSKFVSEEPERAFSNVQEETQACASEVNRNEIPPSDFTESGEAQENLHMGDKRDEPNFGKNLSLSLRQPDMSFSRDKLEDTDEGEVRLMNAITLAQNQSVEKMGQKSNEQDEPLNEKSSVAADVPRVPMVQRQPFLPELSFSSEALFRAGIDSYRAERVLNRLEGPLCFELPGDIDGPTPYPYPTSQGVLSHSPSTHDNESPGSHMALMPSQMNLEAVIRAPPRSADLSTSKSAVSLPFSRRFFNRSGQIWHGFEALILRIEYRRRRGRSRSSVFLVRMMWKPMQLSDCSWTSVSMQRRIDHWLYLSQYYTIFVFGNILLNLLYCIFLFPFILWVLYRHHDVLERPRTQEQFQASMEMLGRLPERYSDYELLEQRVLRNLESGSAGFL